jgi:hypothetical protein
MPALDDAAAEGEPVHDRHAAWGSVKVLFQRRKPSRVRGDHTTSPEQAKVFKKF